MVLMLMAMALDMMWIVAASIIGTFATLDLESRMTNAELGCH